MAMAVRLAICLLFAGLAPCSCEEGPPQLPRQETGPQQPPTIDLPHSARVRGDKRLTIANLQFVIQRDPAGGELTGLTLWSTKPGPDGSRLIFGATERMASLGHLARIEIRLGGVRIFDAGGSGIFTSLVAYQPKRATLKITQFGETDVRGTIDGEFYRFSMIAPSARPEVVTLEVDFSAALIVR